MANTQSAKAANGITNKTAAPSSAPVGDELDFTIYVRDNAPRIVSALTCSAQVASEAQNWVERQAYLSIADTIISQTGLYNAIAFPGVMPNRTMGAAAGAGT